MKNLEEKLVVNFYEAGKKVSLTEAGDRLLSFVRPFLDQMENIREELDGFEKFGTGVSDWEQVHRLADFFFHRF